MAKDRTGSITTHIDHDHHKENIFGKEDKNRHDGGHPKVKEGCYANAEGRNQETIFKD